MKEFHLYVCRFMVLIVVYGGFNASSYLSLNGPFWNVSRLITGLLTPGANLKRYYIIIQVMRHFNLHFVMRNKARQQF